jgi:hypothetical protein
MSVDKAVEFSSHLHAVFMLEQRLGFDRRPGQMLQVAQLKSAPAIDVILQAALAELELNR